MQDTEGNAENGYLVPVSKKTKINYAKETDDVHKNSLNEEILQVNIKNFMRMLLDVVNQNIKEALKKFQDTKNKEYEKTQNK
jgi:hypothetical protein